MGTRYNRTHGQSSREHRTSEYIAYVNARDRCTNPRHPQFSDYGGRGIRFEFTSFTDFIDTIGMKPSPDLTLDRIDNDGDYILGNVRWSSRRDQALNRRPRKRNHVHPPEPVLSFT